MSMAKRSPNRPELAALIARAQAAWDAMTPEEKFWHREAQRRSWLRGEMGMSGYTNEQIDAAFKSLEEKGLMVPLAAAQEDRNAE